MRKNALIILVSLLIFCSTANAEMVVNQDGTVTDTATGLMWQQDGAGQMNWETALSYCENLVLAGYDDWRLPNINELQSLVDYSTYDPAIDTSAFPHTMSYTYWSSTTYSNITDSAWSVHFYNGVVGTNYKLNNMYGSVRAVRSGQ